MCSLSLLWLYVALPGVLWASHTTLMVEGDNDASKICKPAPHWDIKGQTPMQELLGNVVVVALLKASWQFCLTQAYNIGGLRDKLSRSNLTEVSFMIVNEREARSRAMYWELKRRAPSGVPVYQQAPFQNDVWEALDGDKDDFLVYDRCGLLTFHIVLPYSFLHYPYVEAAIRATYHKNICNCSANSTFSSGTKSSMKNETAPLNSNKTTTLPTIQLDADDPEEGDRAPGIHQHTPDHHRHHHQHSYHHASQQTQSHHVQDTGQNETQNLHPLNHHHYQPHPQHHH
ncbi:selenoprotein Pb [Xiphias gladius]|uniref:selenoprotein Pb n=1 Tax=Xiphias gladius TaxID=8245 RepID=UPI001A9A0B56|nr:selenoprotein Pb [Xiphias gladius]XP_040000375.1 selenoprotein Pb [Xiphias gladius]